jgi:3-oxoacyl-(acyl-carrier-protein) synthase
MLCGGVEAVTPARALLESVENTGEASVFFVLENADHAAQRSAPNTAAIDDRVLEAASSNMTSGSAHTVFGNCGGATSALALAQVLALSR